MIPNMIPVQAVQGQGQNQVNQVPIQMQPQIPILGHVPIQR